jgi:hypothetical protein
MNIIEFINEVIFYRLGLKLSIRRIAPSSETPFIIIHVMGKVASSSIKSSLERYNLDANIYQTDMLTEETWKIKKNARHLSERFAEIDRREYIQGKLLRKRIEELKEKNQKCKVITLTREPMSQCASRFFHVIDWLFFPGVAERYEKDPSVLQEVKDYYLKEITKFGKDSSMREGTRERMFQYYLNRPLVFFDKEVKQAFDIDVYSGKFPKDKGYKIYHGKCADLLLIKFEKVKDCFEDAFKDFLNIDSFVLKREGITGETPVGKLYKDFRQSIVLPDDFVNKFYSSKYARHFYTDDEITTFKKKWTTDLSKK